VQAEQSGRELGLLTEIERDPDITQAGLATKLGVAVGTVNWHLRVCEGQACGEEETALYHHARRACPACSTDDGVYREFNDSLSPSTRRRKEIIIDCSEG